MNEPTFRVIRTNGIDMHVAEQGEGPLVVLCHGFPELWYSWRHQLPALARAGYHAVAPDQRGYGGTDQPAAIDAYDIVDLTDDMLGLLDALGEERAVFVGHDWGAPVVWHLALRAPERVRGVVGMSVPFLARGPVDPLGLLDALFADRFFYILYFQEPGVADAELALDPKDTLRRFMAARVEDAPGGAFPELPREGTGVRDWLPIPDRLPASLTDDDLERFASEFRRTGFTGGLNWYRNMRRNWELTEAFTGVKIAVPAMFVAGELDPVLAMLPVDGMDEWVADLRGKLLVPGAGHWIQQERPAEVNAALLEFLAGLS